jgi:hypothetical protein
MILASSVSLGKSDSLVELAQNLKDFALQAAKDGSSHYTVERGVLDHVLKIGAAAMNLFLQAQGNGDLGPSIEAEDGPVLYRSDTVVNRPLRTIFGEHTLASTPSSSSSIPKAATGKSN